MSTYVEPTPETPDHAGTHRLTCLPFQIHRAKAEKARERQLKEEMDAKRAKTKAARERKVERQTAKRNALMEGLEEEK